MESSDSFLSASSPSSQSLSLSPSMTIMENIRETPQPQYLKLEDLQSSASPATTVFDGTTGSQQSPATVIIHSKPAKKRKSWGQPLPEPKTNLPPRKRAKTEDEKLQRKVERIKRNRAAAHNSRERKRQETENLAVLLARARAELDAYRRLHGPLPSDVVLPEVTLNKDPEFPEQLKYSDSASSCMPSPATSLIDNIKQEPSDNTVSPMDMFEELDDSNASPLPTLDVTQHSAEMLCDLPCPSSLRSVRRTPHSLACQNRISSKPSSTFHPSPAWWARLFLYLTHLHTQTAYKQILLAIWSISPSRMQALITLASNNLSSASRRNHYLLTTTTAATASSTTTPTVSSSTTSSIRTQSRLLRSTQLLAQLNAATSRASRARPSVIHTRSDEGRNSHVVVDAADATSDVSNSRTAAQTRNGVQDES